MQYNNVELCGVDTSKLKVLSEEEKRGLLIKMRDGTPDERKKAREELINGNECNGVGTGNWYITEPPFAVAKWEWTPSGFRAIGTEV